MKLGETYHYCGHLWIVISHPDPSTGAVAVVNFTSWGQDKDHSCIVEMGDHPFIDRKTVVAYDFARLLDTSAQLAFVAASSPDVPVTDVLLEEIQAGADDSEFTPPNVIAAVKVSVRQQIADKRQRQGQ